MARRNNRSPLNTDPNPSPWNPTDEDITASAAVRPIITTADLLVPISNPTPEPIRPRENFSVDGRSVASRSAEAPWQIVYGNARVGGTIVFISTDQAESGEFLHVVVVLAAHKIESVDKLFLDGKEVTFGGGGIYVDPRWGSGEYTERVFMAAELGDPDQVAQSDLVAQSAALFPGKWTTEHRLRGLAYAYLILKFDPEIFANGFPEISFEVHGRNEIYDPRIDDYVYTDNAPLCIADYYTNADFGCGADFPTEVDEDALIDAADVADEAVDLAAGGTEARYTLNGSFLTTESRRQVLTKMLTTIGGEETAVGIGGKVSLFPKKWRAPTISLDENDMRSGVRVKVKASRRDTFNQVRGTYVDASNGFQVSDFPAITNALYLSEDDGIENVLDVSYPFTTSAATAQRLSKIKLEEARQPITVEFVCALRGFLLQTGDVVSLTYARFGWEDKPFRVTVHDVALDSIGGVPSIGIPLVLRETAEGVYDWNDGEETTVDLAPNTFLPSVSVVQAPAGLTLESGTDHLYIRSDGTIFSRIFAEWSQLDPFVPTSGRHEIQYKKSAASDWQDATPVPGSSTSTYILDVQDGQFYDVRVRSVNGFNFTSAWTTALGHEVIGKTEFPSDVSGFTATIQPYGVFLSWLGVPDLDLSHYEIREGSSWGSSTLIAEITSTSISVDFRTAGTHTFLIRAVDTTRNQSQFAASAVVIIAAPSQPLGTFTIAGPNAVLDWNESSGQYAIDKYKVFRGATYGTSTLVVETKSTAYTLTVDWSGTESFYIVAVDVAGNLSSVSQIDVIVSAPGAVGNLRADVFDNNALLKWDVPSTGTLPVTGYNIYKGDTFSGAESVGEVRGTFFAYFELIAGTYTYWVAPLDSAGNIGTETPITAKIDQPPDFVFLDDAQLTPEDFNTLSNVVFDGASLVGPVDTTITFEDHFIDNGWSTIQDQIDDGYPYYVQPGLTDGYAEEVIDFGVVVPSSLIKLTYSSTLIDLPITIVPLIEWSEDDITYYTADGTTVLATNFQFVRIRLTFDGSDATSLASVQDVRVRLDVKLQHERGTASAVSTDADGTYIEFETAFLDIRKITITAESEDPTIVAYNFVDVPEPTGFNVKVWDETGTRISKTISYDAEGVR